MSQELKELLAVNEELKQKFNNNICFRLMREGKFQTNEQAAKFLACYQPFSDGFQKAIHIRAAFCDDEYFKHSFKKHFNEEIGHNDLLYSDRKSLGLVEIKKDPILTALTSWFAYKMLSGNHYEQAVVLNLCIESAAPVIYENAGPVINSKNNLTHFKAHEGEIDLSHFNLGVELLTNLTEPQYRKLTDVLQESWSIVNALFKRMAEISLNIAE